MHMKKSFLRFLSVALAAGICAGVSTPAAFAKGSYNDMDAVTSHVNLKLPGGLTVSRPAKDITTSAATYFITGNSNPDQTLTMNGEPVTTRGARGSFGVFVALEQGDNSFTFQQSGAKKTVVITRGNAAAADTINNVRSMTPGFDCATISGSKIRLSCVAPSGSTVVATVGGKQITLKQQAATAQVGVPATFSAETTAGSVKGTKNLGKVTYTLNGKTAYESAGSVFVTGEGATLAVQVKNNAASIYKDEAASAFIETAHKGGVDTVVEIGSSMYQLSTGGWVPKDSVTPLTETPTLKNLVTSASFGRTEDGRGELLTFAGSGAPMYRAVQDTEKLVVWLYNTTVDSVQMQELENAVNQNSRLFSGAQISAKESATVLTLPLSGKRGLWGYDIQYLADGGVYVYAKYTPAPGGSAPLAGLTIAVDAGHGGTDPGAIGIPGTAGATEEDITLATAIAVQKRLESLGAKVVMCRTEKSDVSMNARMDVTRDAYADLFLSIHCNSIGYDKDVNKVGGTEVYYFEAISAKLASALSANISAYTGRTNRGAKRSNYRVTLNSFAPSVLIELGFLTNPSEYDSMASRQGIFQTANAIGDSVLAYFS